MVICWFIGEVAERLKAHAWKACLGKPNVGSNPTLSAKKTTNNYQPVTIKRELRNDKNTMPCHSEHSEESLKINMLIDPLLRSG